MKVLCKQLLEEIAGRLRADGYRRSQQTFSRDFPGGRWLFHVAFIPHADDFDVTADIALRHDAIQEASRHYGHLSDQEKKKTATLGVELGNLQGLGQHRWTVRMESDVVPVAESILKMFREFGVPFLQRYASVEETKKAFLGDERFARLICPGREYREEIISHFKTGAGI
jgi:hypothetical protein